MGGRGPNVLAMTGCLPWCVLARSWSQGAGAGSSHLDLGCGVLGSHLNAVPRDHPSQQNLIWGVLPGNPNPIQLLSKGLTTDTDWVVSTLLVAWKTAETKPLIWGGEIFNLVTVLCP